MSDAMNASYAQQQQFAQQQYANAMGPAAQMVSDERATTRIRQRAQKHAAEINEMVANVEQLANMLFGHIPSPPSPPTSGAALGQIEPVKPQIDAIDSAQFLIDEALASLRQQLSRFAAL